MKSDFLLLPLYFPPYQIHNAFYVLDGPGGPLSRNFRLLGWEVIYLISPPFKSNILSGESVFLFNLKWGEHYDMKKFSVTRA